MRTTLLALAAGTMALTVAAPAAADPPPWAKAHGKRAKDAQRYYQQRQAYYPQQQYYQTDNGIRYWEGDDGRYRCRRSDGTTGLLVGGAAGALAGRAIDTRGDRATGTIIGAAAGALLGREVERRVSSCR